VQIRPPPNQVTKQGLAHQMMAKFRENRSELFIPIGRDVLGARSGVDVGKFISVGDKFLGGPNII
jgi:hypothetical protein